VETTHSFRSSRVTTRFALNGMESTDATEWTTTATCRSKGCSARHSAVGQNDSIRAERCGCQTFLLHDIEVLI